MFFNDLKGLKFWKFNVEILKKRHEKRKVKGRYACMHRRAKICNGFLYDLHFLEAVCARMIPLRFQRIPKSSLPGVRCSTWRLTGGYNSNQVKLLSVILPQGLQNASKIESFRTILGPGRRNRPE